MVTQNDQRGRHGVFEFFTLFVIAVNACWLGWDSDRNKSPTLDTSKAYFQGVENFFCIYFTTEARHLSSLGGSLTHTFVETSIF